MLQIILHVWSFMDVQGTRNTSHYFLFTKKGYETKKPFELKTLRVNKRYLPTK